MSPFEDLVRTTLCLGVQAEGEWAPLGCGFVAADERILWLVTSSRVLERAEGQPLTVWVARHQGGALLGLGAVLQQAGLEWLRAEHGDVAACAFPAQADWDVKAIPLLKSVAGGLPTPLMNVHALAFPYGVDGFDPRQDLPILLPGGVAGVDEARARIYHTAPSLPLNEGAPLMLATGVGAQRQLLLVGVANGPVRPAAPVPAKEIPPTVAALSVATPIKALVELLGSEAARDQADRVLARAAQSQSEE